MNRHLGRSEGVVWVGVVADDLMGVAIGAEIEGENSGKGSTRKGAYSIVILDKDTLQVSRRIPLASGTTIPFVNSTYIDNMICLFATSVSSLDVEQLRNLVNCKFEYYKLIQRKRILLCYVMIIAKPGTGGSSPGIQYALQNLFGEISKKKFI